MSTATAVGLANLVLGSVYTCYGLMTLLDMKRGWRTNGFSHFGAAWTAMAFTCGPHHLDHGAHVLAAGRAGGWLDLASILVGFPAGIAWFLLRVEAMFGGRGERFISGTPAWVEALPTAFAAYSALVIGGLIWTADGRSDLAIRAMPNLALVALYSAIAFVLVRTQFRTHLQSQGWSVSGLSLALVMYTCAVMHGVFVLYASIGQYDLDWHGLVIDIAGVPAAAYFLWVTWALYRGWMGDWNAVPSEPSHATRPVVAIG